MKLKDVVGTKNKYDASALARDGELTRDIQTRLVDLGLLKPPVDGIFGPLSTAALHRFQSLTQCGEPGYLGPITAKKLIEAKVGSLPKTLTLKIIKDTVLKTKPLQSSELLDTEKLVAKLNQTFEILAFEPIRNHVRVALLDSTVGNSGIWYVFGEHAEIYEGNTKVFPPTKPQTIRLNVPYKSQLDNWYNPTGSCNVTSLAMCLEFLGAKRKNTSGQFEDELYVYALNRGYSRHNPYDLAQIVREYGCKDNFTENGTIEGIQDWLTKGNPCVIHGYFTSFGHVMPVVGYDQDGFYVHDPYGEWFKTGYRTDLSGAYLHYSYELIRNVCMPDGSFWVHYISK